MIVGRRRLSKSSARVRDTLKVPLISFLFLLALSYQCGAGLAKLVAAAMRGDQTTVKSCGATCHPLAGA
jgi:hypothetical protein